MSKLPKEQTSVVTILRNPIERVFSTYEFSIEVAARFLVHPNLTSVLKMSNRLRSKNGGISTLDIWPWKYLVPWMREDLFSRVGLLFLKIFVDFVYNFGSFIVILFSIIIVRSDAADEYVCFDVMNSEMQEREGAHLNFMGMIHMIWRKLLCHYMIMSITL